MNSRILILPLLLLAPFCISQKSPDTIPPEPATAWLRRWTDRLMPGGDGEIPPIPVPPPTGDAASLREPPDNAPYGQPVNGLRLGLWSEKSSYEFNTRMNVWMMLSNGNKDASGHIKPYGDVIFDNSFLTISDARGKQTWVRCYGPEDGIVGMGFAGGLSEILHEHIRRAGVYKVQWKIRSLESNIIEIDVTPPKSETTQP